MKCLQCGYCCCTSLVVTIKPEYVNESITRLEDLSEDAFVAIDANVQKCPHQSWDDTKSICDIHHYDWYKLLPCHSHTQIESTSNDECRMGRYVLDNKLTNTLKHEEN